MRIHLAYIYTDGTNFHLMQAETVNVNVYCYYGETEILIFSPFSKIEQDQYIVCKR